MALIVVCIAQNILSITNYIHGVLTTSTKNTAPMEQYLRVCSDTKSNQIIFTGFNHQSSSGIVRVAHAQHQWQHIVVPHCQAMTGSNSSGSLSWSLRSQGTINPANQAAVSTCKANATWGKEHVKEMLDFLIDKLPEMGDGEFKMQTWNQVAVHMRSKFPLAEGEGERTAESCRSKFTRVCIISRSLIIKCAY